MSEGKVKFLSESLDKQISNFDRWAKNDKRRAFWIKMAVTTFGAAVTVLLGLQGIKAESLNMVKNIALILSALVTLFGAWDAFFSHREMWLKYVNTSNQLKGIRAELKYLMSEGTENIKEEDIERLFVRNKAVLDELNLEYIRVRGDSSLKKKE